MQTETITTDYIKTLKRRLTTHVPDANHMLCIHSHEILGTAIFYKSFGVLQCNKCSGYQLIKGD